LIISQLGVFPAQLTQENYESGYDLLSSSIWLILHEKRQIMT